jgi:hypothetical protein
VQERLAFAEVVISGGVTMSCRSSGEPTPSLKDAEVAAGDALDGGDGLDVGIEGGEVRMDDGGR